MYEIEIKILDVDAEQLKQRLLALGAIKRFEGEMEAVYYDTLDKYIKRNRGTFRLRREGTRAVLTYKGYVENSAAKIREETEVEVSDFNAMKSILKSLGYSAWVEMKKERTTYELDRLHFEFDKYHGEYEYIPEFLEIEGTDMLQILKYANLLGFTEKDCRPWDALQVADYYRSAASAEQGSD